MSNDNLIERLRRRKGTVMISGYLTSTEQTDPICAKAADALTAQAAEIEALRVDAERYRWLAAHCRSTSEHWGGRWSIVVEGPAPKSHNSEDDFDAAIDAALTGKAVTP